MQRLGLLCGDWIGMVDPRTLRQEVQVVAWSRVW
jgi:hypothetical protein